jgi:hypothetical protein
MHALYALPTRDVCIMLAANESVTQPSQRYRDDARATPVAR